MTKILSGVLKESDAGEADKICYLLLGELVPAYRGVDFNIAEKIMLRVLASAYGKKLAGVTASYKSKGDLGDVAYELVRAERTRGQHPTVSLVYEKLLAIARESGEGSQERRVGGLAKILAALDPLSAKYVTRIPIGKLRLGFSDATLLDALSVMVKGDKSARPVIERAYNVTADIGAIAKRVKSSGLRGLERLAPTPRNPLPPPPPPPPPPHT